MDDNFTTSDDTPQESIDRGKRRIALVQNRIAFEIFGQADDEELQITEADFIKCEVLAIRILLALRDQGLIDNEPMLNLATLEELLNELERRGEELGMSVDREDKSAGYLLGMAQAARNAREGLRQTYTNVLHHAEKKRKPISLEDMIEAALPNSGDTTEKEDPQ